MNNERKLIYVILNDIDVEYDLEEQPTQYVVYIRHQTVDTRQVSQVNDEIKHEFADAGLDFSETVAPKDKKADIVLVVKRK